MELQDKHEVEKRGRYKNIDNERIAAVFAKKGCNMSATADALNVSRATLYNWRNEDSELDSMMKDQEESLIDFSESKLMESIQEGNLTAIIFHLKTKGKNRGYVEGQEIRATVATTKTMTPDEAKDFLQNLEEQY